MRNPLGHSFGITPETVERPDPQRWRDCGPYLYGIDLFNHSFYWEAHEVWEGLWKACGRRGPTALFLKGLIHLAAAGVKTRVGNVEGVKRHAQRAAKAFHAIAVEIGSRGVSYMGLDVASLEQRARSIAEYPAARQADRGEPGWGVFKFVLWPE